MTILFDQLKKIKLFIYILFLLFFVNLIFNLNYNWAGISVIVRVYLFVFSFFLVYNFSQLDIPGLRDTYKHRYGVRGDVLLFLITRVSPFLIIYFVTILFTLVDYAGSPDWPFRPFLDLLDGRYSNNIIYSLILLIILRIEKDPKITVPLFLSLFVLYFILYKIVYNYSHGGAITSFLKFSNFVGVMFFLIYEFFYGEKRLFKATFISVIFAIVMYLSVVFFNVSVYTYSDVLSFPKIRSSMNLLKMGYSFPFGAVKKIVAQKLQVNLIKELIYYSHKYDMRIDYSSNEWERLLSVSSVRWVDIICDYLNKTGVDVSFDKLLALAKDRSITNKEALGKSEKFIAYTAGKYENHISYFWTTFHRQNYFYKLWALEVVKKSSDNQSIPYLANLLTDIDSRISFTAYDVLKHITGEDPVDRKGLKCNSPGVIRSFYEYYQAVGDK